VSSLPTTPPHSASTSAQHHIKCAQKQERARKNHVKRPADKPIHWEKTTAARLKSLPADHVYACSADQWNRALKSRINISHRRVDFRTTFENICEAIAYAFNPETGILRITWSALAKLASTSISGVQRVLRMLKEHQLITVIASGRSANMTPKGHEKKNLAPVYGLTVPAPPLTETSENHDSFYDENGYLFVTDCPSPLRDKKISYQDALKEGVFDQFCKQRYALYAHTHRDALEKKRQGLEPIYPTIKAKKQALIHLARALQHHCLDLRSLSAKAITEAAQPFFDAGWTVRDVLYALEYRPDNSAYNTKGAAGMRSVKKWLILRMKAWTQNGLVMDSRTALEEREFRARTSVSEPSETTVEKKVSAPSPEVKRRIKVALLGEDRARIQYPELF